MAKKVKWSIRAHNDRRKILAYWIDRNKSNRYSIRLNGLFKDAIAFISEYPKIGKLTDVENVRIKIVRDYFIIYEESENEIHILTIWNSYQNPDQLEWTFQ